MKLFSKLEKKLKKQFLLRKNTYFWKRCSFGSQFFYELIPNLLRHPVYNTFIVINIFIFNVDVNLHCIGVVSVTYMTWPKAMFKKKWRTQWKRIEYDVLTSKSFSINVCLEALVYSVITLLHAPSHLLCTLCSCTIQNPVYTVCAHMFMLEIQRMKDLPNSIYRDFLQKVLSYSLLNHTWRYIFETYIYPFFLFFPFFLFSDCWWRFNFLDRPIIQLVFRFLKYTFWQVSRVLDLCRFYTKTPAVSH